MKKIISCLVVTALVFGSTFSSTKSEASLGIVALGTLPAVGMWFIVPGAIFTGLGIYHAIEKRKIDMETIVITLVGVLLLKSTDGSNCFQFNEITQQQARGLGVSFTEMKSYNSEVTKLNLIGETVDSKVASLLQANPQTPMQELEKIGNGVWNAALASRSISASAHSVAVKIVKANLSAQR